MAAIFISYNNKDENIAGKIKDWLVGLGYERTYFACDLETGNQPGEQWEQRLYQELSRSHAIVIVLTRNWLESKWCWAEMVVARTLGKTIIQVICSPQGDQMVLPQFQAVYLLDWNEAGLQRLEQGLRAISDELARGFAWDPHRAPFPGMKAFEPEDAAIYFGRDAETNAVRERLEAGRTLGSARMLVITGSSGAGKSSLLKAGLMPQLRRHRREWLVLPTIRPEKAPLDMLSKSIAHSLQSSEWKAWRERLIGSNAIDAIAELLEQLRVGDAILARVLLSIDQLEELFTVSEPSERKKFIRLLAAALAPDRQLPLAVIATARYDLLEGLLDRGELASITETHHLVPLPLERVPKLINGPAAAAGLHVEEGLVDEIRRDLQHVEALPLLSHALSLLYDAGKGDRRLSLAQYRSLGDPVRDLNPIQNSVRQVADRILERLKPRNSELEALRDAFVPHLVRVRLEDGRYVRQSALRSQLPPKSRPLLDALVKERLLVARTEDENLSAQPKDSLIEVAHEALFTAWPTLSGWLDQSHAFLLDIERIKAAYGIWKQAPNGQKAHALLGGLLLSRAREWVKTYPRRFGGSEMKALNAFIVESARAEDAALRRRELEKQEHEQKVREQRDKALLTQSLFLAALAEENIRAGDACTGMLLAIEALPNEEVGALDRPYSPEPELALFRGFHGLMELAVLAAHVGPVQAAALSSDGRYVVTASHDKTARVWAVDANEPRVIATLSGHSGPVLSAAFSPDACYVVTASWDRTARVWQEAGAELATLREHQSAVVEAQFSADGSCIVTASDDTTARVWSAKDGRKVSLLRGHQGRVTTAEFSPDGRFVITASDDRTARLWEAETGRELHKLEGHAQTVTGARFSPDGEHVITASEDGTARVWDALTGQPGPILKGHGGWVTDARFSHDGKRIVTASADKSARIWAADAGSTLHILKGHDGLLSSARFSWDGERVVTAARDRTARIWNAENGASEAILAGHGDAVTGASFSPDGTRVVSASTDRTSRLWKSRNAPLTLAGHQGAIASAVFSPNGDRVLTVSEDNTARIWNAETGEELVVFSKHHASVNAGTFSPDGEQVLTGASDTTLRLWNPNTGKENHVIEGHTGAVLHVTFNSDGRHLMTASSDRTARLWDVATRAEIVVLHHHAPVRSAAFSSDEKYVLTACEDGVARLWEVPAGHAQFRLCGHRSAVTSARFSPDGLRIVTASADSTLRIWSLDGEELALVENEESAANDCEFDLTGSRILTAHSDGTGRIWGEQNTPFLDRPVWRQVADLEGHGAALSTARFSPDGRRVVTASCDHSARIWEVFPTTRALVEHSKRIVPRCLSQPQRRSAFLDPKSPGWCIEMQKWHPNGQTGERS
jgi:WD40 repeat protein